MDYVYYKDEELYTQILEFDLTKNVEDIKDDFFKFMQEKKTDDMKVVIKKIVKGYIAQNRADELESCLDKNTNSLKVSAVLKKFVSEYILLKPIDNNVQLAGLFDIIAQQHIERLKELSGDIIYINTFSNNFAYAKYKNVIKQNLEKICIKSEVLDGWYHYLGDISLEIKPQNQNTLLDLYERVTRNYFLNCRNFLSNNSSYKEIADYASLLGKIVKNIDKRLTEKSKTTKSYELSKLRESKFFNDELENLFGLATLKKKENNNFESLRESLLNIKKDEYTQKDITNLEKFIDEAVEVDKVLSITDENGNHFPANFYKVVKMSPNQFNYCVRIIRKFPEEMLKAKQDTILAAYLKVKTMISTSQSKDNEQTVLNVEEELKKNRQVVTLKGQVVDMRNDDVLKNVANKVENCIKENNLARYQSCIAFLAKSLMFNKNPICLEQKDNQDQFCK